MIQLPLLPPPVVAPTIPAASTWARIGAWLVGDAPEPPELAVRRESPAESIRIIADAHRARVRASWGGR